MAAKEAIKYVSVNTTGTVPVIASSKPGNAGINDVNGSGTKDMMDATVTYQGILTVIGNEGDVDTYMDIYLAADVDATHELDATDASTVYSND